jgi:hypothetical protein
MSVGGPKLAVSKIKPKTQTPPEVQASETSHDSELPALQWDDAVSAAAVLLDKTFGSFRTADDPMFSDMARDLAARLCAYAEVVETAEPVPPNPHSLP